MGYIGIILIVLAIVGLLHVLAIGQTAAIILGFIGLVLLVLGGGVGNFTFRR